MKSKKILARLEELSAAYLQQEGGAGNNRCNVKSLHDAVEKAVASYELSHQKVEPVRPGEDPRAAIEVLRHVGSRVVAVGVLVLVFLTGCFHALEAESTDETLFEGLECRSSEVVFVIQNRDYMGVVCNWGGRSYLVLTASPDSEELF